MKKILITTALLFSLIACKGSDIGTVDSISSQPTKKGEQFTIHIKLDKGGVGNEGPFFDVRKCKVGARWPSCYSK